MNHFSLRRSIVGSTLGALLLSGPFAYGYDDYRYDPDSQGDSYERADSDQSYHSDQHENYKDRRSSPPPNYPPPTAQSASGAGAPFGVSKSTAGAITGALLGAGSGAIIGSHKGRAGQGALIGAGLGAVGGYLTGRQIEAQDHALDEQDQQIKQQQQEIARNREIIEELKRQKLDAKETKRGVVVNLPDVLFEFNSSRLTIDAQDKVSHIASVLKQRASERRISIEGHTDSIGSDSYNLALSEQRAQAVARELSADGVREKRLAARGFGEKYPVAPNTREDGSDNPSGRAKNRRVEVVIEN
jgi:outer membrane protein OmpA-like peptidoglycan-associated protein